MLEDGRLGSKPNGLGWVGQAPGFGGEAPALEEQAPHVAPEAPSKGAQAPTGPKWRPRLVLIWKRPEHRKTRRREGGIELFFRPESRSCLRVFLFNSLTYCRLGTPG
jgi:hypothetical protein